MVRLELTLAVDPQQPEGMEDLARELAAVLPPAKHQALVALARAICSVEGLIASPSIQPAWVLPDE